MATPMHCDYEGHYEAFADMIVSRVDNGETSAWCFEHYVYVCQAIIDAAEAAVRERTDAEAAATLAAVQAPDVDDVDDGTLAALANVALTTSPDVDDVDVLAGVVHAQEAQAAALTEPTVARVVKRGTSPSRRAHEARQRARKQEVVPEAMPAADAEDRAPGTATEAAMGDVPQP